jgi:hypothetical protein
LNVTPMLNLREKRSKKIPQRGRGFRQGKEEKSIFGLQLGGRSEWFLL